MQTAPDGIPAVYKYIGLLEEITAICRWLRWFAVLWLSQQIGFERIINMKNGLSWLLILLNAIGCLCLAYSSYLFLSGSTIVDAPDAMLPMERWERGGWLLTIGMIPLIITNIFGYGYIQFGNKKNRLLIFIPSVICIILVACFWMKSIR